MRAIDDRVTVQRLPESSNPIFYRGCKEDSFSLQAGEHFVIGETTFSLSKERACATLDIPDPISQKTFTHDSLRRIRYRDADQRIAAINQLPDIISSAGIEQDLLIQLINVLLAGIPTASAAAIVCRAVERHGVELLPTSPTFLNLLLISEAYRNYDLSSLKLITYGTEPMPEYTLKRVHEIFPDVRLLQTYGLSELGILRSKSKDSTSLWVKVGGEGFETKVVDGTLWIRAKSAMLGYLNAPSPFDADGWFNTGDAVQVDGEYIRILGRQSEIINVGGEKVYPAEVESVLMQMENIKDVVVRGERNPITGNMVVARVNLSEPEDPITLKKRIRAFCKDKLARFKIPVKVELADSDQFSARFKKLRRSGDVGGKPCAGE